MANNELDAYLKERSSEWDECRTRLRDEIGLTPQSFKLHKPYMLVIDDEISGHLALTFMKEKSLFSDERFDISQLSELAGNIQTAFEQFNNQLPDAICWRKMGHIGEPHNADIYCPPLNEITKRKYDTKTFEMDDELVTRSLDTVFDNTSILRLILVSLPSLLFWPFTFIYGLRRTTRPIPGKKDKQWIQYLIQAHPGSKQKPIETPDKIDDFITSIYHIYDCHNITLSDDEISTIQSCWKKKEFWPRKLDGKLQALGKQTPVNNPDQTDYSDWITSLNKALKANKNIKADTSIIHYMLCTLLLPVLSAKDFLAMAQTSQDSGYIMNYCLTRLPRSIEEARFIANGIDNSSDIELHRYLLSLILTTNITPPGLERFQLDLLCKLNPEILNLSINKKNTRDNLYVYQIADQMTNTTNPKILLGLITYGSGYITRLANEKLKEIETENRIMIN